MLANLKFTDLFAFLDDGIANASIAVGTTSGSAIQLGGSQNLRKHAFILIGNSGSTSAGVASMYLMTATAASASFTSLSQSLQSISISGAGKWMLVLDTDDSFFGDLATNAAWIKPVVVVAGVAVPLALLSLGYNAGSEQASNFNASTLGGVVELDLFSA